MYLFEAKVLSNPSGSSYQKVPITMTFQCQNMVQARSYFQNFGRIVAGPYIKNT